MWEVIETTYTVGPNGGMFFRSVSDRLKVFEGWIVRTIVYSSAFDGGSPVGQVFVPDVNHRWKLPE
mgnify:CR=1 FL=1